MLRPSVEDTAISSALAGGRPWLMAGMPGPSVGAPNMFMVRECRCPGR